jgi:quinol monooxygenase YgiN
MIVIAGTIPIDPTKHAEAAAAVTAMMRDTLAEDGCHAYQFSFAADDPAKLCIFEEWESQEALDAHFAMPHMATFMASASSFIVGRADVAKYAVTSKGPVR